MIEIKTYWKYHDDPSDVCQILEVTEDIVKFRRLSEAAPYRRREVGIGQFLAYHRRCGFWKSLFFKCLEG